MIANERRGLSAARRLDASDWTVRFVTLIIACSLAPASAQAAYNLAGAKWEPGGNAASGDYNGAFAELIDFAPPNYGTPGGATWSIVPAGVGDGYGIEFPLHDGELTTDFFALTSGDEAAMVNEALNLWAAVSGFKNLGQVADGGVDFGELEEFGGHLGDIRIAAIHSPFLAEWGALAHSLPPGTEGLFGLGGTVLGDVHIENAFPWADDPSDFLSLDLFTVLLHELGHALGLDHSDDFDSVMFEAYLGPYRQLGADDIAGIQAIYGPPVPEPGTMILWSLGMVVAAGSRSAWHRKPSASRKPRLERLEDRLALSGFGPEDGAYIVAPWGGTYEAVSIRPGDQAIVAAGAISRGSGVARYDSLGNMDASYGSGGMASVPGLQRSAYGAGTPLALQPDGKAIVTGSISGTKAAAARLAASGQLDTGFGSAGKASFDAQSGISDIAYAVGQQSNGKVVVAGISGSKFLVARFRTNGTLDTGKDGFGGGNNAKGYTLTTIGGAADPVGFMDLAIQADDKIVAVGSFRTTGSLIEGSRLTVARYTAKGVLDTTFGGSGYAVLLPAGFDYTLGQTVALQSDGKIVVAGYSTGSDGWSDMIVARYNVNGTLDTGFGDGAGYVRLDIDGDVSETIEYAQDLAIQPDGKIIAVGRKIAVADGDKSSVLVACLNSDGSLDDGSYSDSTPGDQFRLSGHKLVDPPAGHGFRGEAVALQSDGSIIVGGIDDGPAAGSADFRPLLMRFSGASAAPAVVAADSVASATAGTAEIDAALVFYLMEEMATPTTRRK